MITLHHFDPITRIYTNTTEHDEKKPFPENCTTAVKEDGKDFFNGRAWIDSAAINLPGTYTTIVINKDEWLRDHLRDLEQEILAHIRDTDTENKKNLYDGMQMVYGRNTIRVSDDNYKDLVLLVGQEIPDRADHITELLALGGHA